MRMFIRLTPLVHTVIGMTVLTAAGCGGGVSDVSGKVTFKGKPVVYGTVVVIGSDGIPKSGPIEPDGSYRVPKVAVGPAKVAVTSPPPPGVQPVAGAKGKGRGDDNSDKVLPPPPAVNPELVKNWFPLPERYADPEHSGLTTDVKSGHSVDLNLK